VVSPWVDKKEPRTKIRAAYLSVASNSSLSLIKLFAGVFTGSISILAEALHSMNDLIASGIAAYAVKHSSKPPDKEHRYGHGKIEDISGLLEATMIIFAAIFIIHDSIERVILPRGIEIIELGIGVMLVSVILNTGVSLNLYRVARKTDSSALYADAAHLSADVITSLGVFAGLVVIRVTGALILDPVIAISVALFIIWTGARVIVRCSRGLMDTSITSDEEKKVREVIEMHRDMYIEFHGLRSRISGAERYIDLHLAVKRSTPVKEGHDLADHIEKEIKKKIPGTHVMIHLEPCEDSMCGSCRERFSCRDRPAPRNSKGNGNS
jgi:cation diffusion facilitator family transporter